MRLSSHLLVHLPYLSAVAQFRSFTQAADLLHVTQAAVSYQIRELEKKTGALLVIRQSGAKTQLTSAGQSLVEEYDVCAKRLQLAFDQLDFNRNKGVLRITTPIDLGSLIMPRVMAKLKESAPELTVQCHTSDEIIDLAPSAWDMAITSVPFEADGRHCFFRSPVLVVAGPEYLRGKKTIKSIECLMEHTVLCKTGSKHSSWRLLMAKADKTFDDIAQNIQLGNTFALIEGAKHNLGLAVLPQFCVKELLNEGKLIQVMAAGFDSQFEIRSVAAPQTNWYERLLMGAFDDAANEV